MTDWNDRYLRQEVSDVVDDAAEQHGIYCRCEYCGEKITYAPSALRLTWLVERVPVGETLSCYYEFFCGCCKALNQNMLGPDVGVILQDAGVTVRKFDVPAEYTERTTLKDTPPLTENDLHEFLGHLSESL